MPDQTTLDLDSHDDADGAVDGHSDGGTQGFVPDRVKAAGLQADTAVRSAANLVTFGLADKAEAAADALFDHSPGDWLQHYKAALNDQVARTAFDASHRPVAQAVGRVAGVGLAAADLGLLGAETSAALPIKAKGLLGEILSGFKTVAKGDLPVAFQVRKKLDNGKTTVVDQTTARGLNVEAKFGPSASLRKNQRYAQKQWGQGYRVDWWLPRHVGYITGTAGGAGGLLSAGLQSQSAQNAPNLNLPDQDPGPQ
jgi:hypothetical protein